MRKCAWLLCWLLPTPLFCSEAAGGVVFEAVPAVIQAGQGASLRVRHSDPRPSTLWQVLPSRSRVPVARFPGPLPSGVEVPIKPAKTMRYELVLEGPTIEKSERRETRVRVVRPGDPSEGHLPAIEKYWRNLPDAAGMNFPIPRDGQGRFRVTFGFTVRHADAVRIYGMPSNVTIWPEDRRTFAVPPGQHRKGVFKHTITVRPSPLLWSYVLEAISSNGVEASALPAALPTMEGGAPVRRPVAPEPLPDTRRPTIHRLAVLEASAASAVRPAGPGRTLAEPLANQAAAPTLSLTTPVSVIFEIEDAAIARLYDGDRLVWESDELPMGRTTRTVPLTAMRSAVFELRALTQTHETIKRARIGETVKEPDPTDSLFN